MKESYIKMRNSGRYDIKWFHRYYTENKGTVELNMFQMVFNHGNLDEVLEYLDKEFNLVKVEDGNGKFIKVCE
jgi:hypothetical protein